MAEMVRARGLRLRGLVRDPASTRARHLAALGVELVVGDLGDRSALLRVARGANAFVHMAAEVGDRASRVRCEQVNVEGTRNAVVAAGEAPAATGSCSFLRWRPMVAHLARAFPKRSRAGLRACPTTTASAPLKR